MPAPILIAFLGVKTAQAIWRVFTEYADNNDRQYAQGQAIAKAQGGTPEDGVKVYKAIQKNEREVKRARIKAAEAEAAQRRLDSWFSEVPCWILGPAQLLVGALGTFLAIGLLWTIVGHLFEWALPIITKG